MKKLIIIFLFLCILTPIALAENNTSINSTMNTTINSTINATTNITTNTTVNTTQNQTNTTNVTVSPTKQLPLPEEFYGDVTYSDGTKVPKGSEIRALNQNDKLIGNFTMTMNGSYGDSYKTAPRLIVYGDKDDVITFYIGSVKSSKSIQFDSGGIKRADITIPSFYKPTPTVPTPEPTPIPTTLVIQNFTLPNVTETITTISTIPPTTVPTIIPVTTTLVQDNNTPSLQLDNITIKFTGVILVAIGVCVAGAILTYYILTKKMKREDEEEIHL